MNSVDLTATKTENGRFSFCRMKNVYLLAFQFDPHCSLFEELKYSEKKSFKKYCFEFSQYKLTYQKDPRVRYQNQTRYTGESVSGTVSMSVLVES